MKKFLIISFTLFLAVNSYGSSSQEKNLFQCEGYRVYQTTRAYTMWGNVEHTGNEYFLEFPSGRIAKLDSRFNPHQTEEFKGFVQESDWYFNISITIHIPRSFEKDRDFSASIWAEAYDVEGTLVETNISEETPWGVECPRVSE